MLNALSFDVEEHFQVSAFASSIARDDWESIPSRVEKNTQALLALLDEQKVRATFFVLGWVAERHPQLVRDIQAQGHEVASHGYSHQLIYKQTPAEFKEETHRSKVLLEDIIQQPVLGYRAASYSITNDSLWALDILAEEGFEYDSSIFPVRHDRYGIPDAEELPHKLTTPNGGSLLEFPLTTFHIGSYRLPIAGGGYFRLFPLWFSRWALGKINQQGQNFIFYLHPWEVDPEQPRVDAPAFSRFRHYNNLSVCQERLEALLTDFKFSSVDEVLREQGFELPRQVV